MSVELEVQPQIKASGSGRLLWAETGVVLLLVPAYLSNGFAEELVMRGYLLRRLGQLCRSTAAGCLLSTALFAACHSYQGPAGVIGTFVLGLVYCCILLASRRLAPIAIAHALEDMFALAGLMD